MYYSACRLNKKFEFLKIKQNAQIFKRDFKNLSYNMAGYSLTDHPYDRHPPSKILATSTISYNLKNAIIRNVTPCSLVGKITCVPNRMVAHPG
jgi:hypothetical protein